jgi:hypothetical protein
VYPNTFYPSEQRSGHIYSGIPLKKTGKSDILFVMGEPTVELMQPTLTDDYNIKEDL